ncbi:MAG TPA: crotonase/enoyl-CoA hydratase family protein [Actinomycetota bacterium]
MSDQPHLLVEKDRHVVTVTMNRPENRNALSAEMIARMYDAWEMINGDDEVRVAILTGAGGDFCAGADLKAMAGGYGEDEWTRRSKEDPELPFKALLRHYRLEKPMIAAVEGYAVAGGTELLQVCDVRVAAEGSTFGLAEVKRALFPIAGSTVRLPRQIPYAWAMDILLTGDFVDAETAYRIGLISRLTPQGGALAEATKVAETIAANGPLSVKAIKRCVTETIGLPEIDALKVELEIGLPIFGTKDAREGPKAFSEKRAPNYTGE